jgi:hypothetical protein
MHSLVLLLILTLAVLAILGLLVWSIFFADPPAPTFRRSSIFNGAPACFQSGQRCDPNLNPRSQCCNAKDACQYVARLGYPVCMSIDPPQ